MQEKNAWLPDHDNVWGISQNASNTSIYARCIFSIFSLPVVTVVRYQHIWPWLFGHHLELILIPLNKLTCNSIALYTSMYIYRTMILRITLPGYIGQVTFSRWNMTRKQTKIHSNFISTYLYILYNILSHEYVKK